MTINIKVIDLETTVNNVGDDAIGTFAASPHAPVNKVVMSGETRDFSLNVPTTEDRVLVYTYFTKDGGAAFGTCLDNEPEERKPNLLVGQNIKFDLLYLMRSKEFRNNLLPKIKVWDTMVVEYLITGQQNKQMSLDKLAIKYGGTVKDDKIKKYWEAGVKTEDIPNHELAEYQKYDVINTDIVFRAQLKIVKELNMLDLVSTQMDALLATTEMEFNGMYFDKEACMKDSLQLAMDLHTSNYIIKKDMENVFPVEFHTNININSNEQLSVLLFGGQLKYDITANVIDEAGNEVKYKTGAKKGLVKTCKHTIVTDVKGLVPGPPHVYGAVAMKKGGIYSTNDKVLKKIKTLDLHTHAGVLVKAILKSRKLNKDLTTYYEGYSKLVWPHDGCIHGTFNHAITDTGRLSHTAPNLGNVAHEK